MDRTNVTYEQWQQVKELFEAALDHRPAERPAFLAQAFGGDEVLKQEVESLLEAHDGDPSFMNTAVGNLVPGAEPVLKAGQHFGPYEEIAPLSEGGMGQVYQALDTRLGRKVALKLLPSIYTTDPERLRRFRQEARAASALNHPNIVTVHEIGQIDSVHFIATEFVEGRTLREQMVNTRMTVGEVLDIGAQIASALQAAHEAGIVHRDVKPENIMLRPDGFVKVLDFGLAKLASKQAVLTPRTPTGSPIKTNPGVIMGTTAYMSPEQARGADVDGGTDIWSSGVVLYEMVAGRAPFRGETPSHVIVSILEREPAPLSLEVEVPAELERIISKALCKQRAERYQTAGDMALDLKQLKEELTVESRLNQFRGTSDADIRETATESDGRVALKTVDPLAANIPDVATSRLTSSAEYNGIRRHRGSAIFASTIALILVASLVYFSNVKSRPAESNLQIKSIAVLPLKNLSGDAAQEYFTDGMTEAMINELAKIGALRVISRQSTMRYKDARKTTPEIARELNVDAIVDGSVSRSGDRVRITAQLIRAATDEHLWAESYERDLHDIMALQGEIARGIAGKIKMKLTPQEQERLAHTPPVNPAAHEAYLKGRYSLNQAIDTPEGDASERLHRKSTEYFEQAVKFDPGYAIAYSGLARSYHWLASSGFQEFYPKAKEAALKALALDDSLAEAHGALAFTIWRHEWDFAGAEREFRKADGLAPNSSSIHGYAHFLSTIGRHDEAIRKIKLAEHHDPLTLFLKIDVGWIYVNARQYDNAIAQFQNVLDLDPVSFSAHQGLGAAYVLKGMHAEGIAEFQTALKLSGRVPDRLNLAWANAMAGRRSEAIQIVNNLKDLQKRKWIPHLRLAKVYGALGEKDLGMAQMEMAYAKHSDGLLWLKVDPELDGLRADPRFTVLMHRVGLPE
ncbi:MAG: protein kinase [Pyrinomonadaceae bacterium]